MTAMPRRDLTDKDIAQALAKAGTDLLQEVAADLPALERGGRLPAARSASGPQWLASCRRVTELTGHRSYSV